MAIRYLPPSPLYPPSPPPGSYFAMVTRDWTVRTIKSPVAESKVGMMKPSSLRWLLETEAHEDGTKRPSVKPIAEPTPDALSS